MGRAETRKDMARPIKKGLDYFPFDVDIFQDGKIRRLRSRYGNDGIIVYIYLLCEIYRTNGYYVEVDEEYLELAADDLNMSVNTIGQILQYLLSRSLFDHTLFQSVTCLSSTGIQGRYQEAVKQRGQKKPITVERKIWLLSEDETRDFIKVTHDGVCSDNNNVYSENNHCYSAEKHHKGKERKGKEIKGVKEAHDTFIKPTQEEVKAYCEERGLQVSPEKFYLHYESKNWMAGSVPITNWRSKIEEWNVADKERVRGSTQQNEKKSKHKLANSHDYNFEELEDSWLRRR